MLSPHLYSKPVSSQTENHRLLLHCPFWHRCSWCYDKQTRGCGSISISPAQERGLCDKVCTRWPIPCQNWLIQKGTCDPHWVNRILSWDLYHQTIFSLRVSRGGPVGRSRGIESLNISIPDWWLLDGSWTIPKTQGPSSVLTEIHRLIFICG